MVSTYTHLPTGREFRSVSGSYSVLKEECIDFGGSTVFYVVATGFADTSCCGMGGCGYALVPGRVCSWHRSIDQEGFFLSEMSPITDEREKKELISLIKKKEQVFQVQFL